MKQRSSLYLVMSILCLALLSACGGPPPETPSTPTAVATTQPELPSERVSFTTSDNGTTTGLFWKGGSTAIIGAHMRGQNKQSFTRIAPYFAAQGYMFFSFDFRGHGESTVTVNDEGMKYDLLAAIGVVKQRGAKQIILLGGSMGATVVLKVAASIPVAAVIALSPGTKESTGFYPSDQEIQGISFPKLFLGSELDYDIAGMQAQYQLASTPKEMQIYPGKAHGLELLTVFNDKEDVYTRILTFIHVNAPLQL